MSSSAARFVHAEFEDGKADVGQLFDERVGIIFAWILARFGDVVAWDVARRNGNLEIMHRYFANSRSRLTPRAGFRSVPCKARTVRLAVLRPNG
jgi:hypothetical protein